MWHAQRFANMRRMQIFHRNHLVHNFFYKNNLPVLVPLISVTVTFKHWNTGLVCDVLRIPLQFNFLNPHRVLTADYR